MSMPNVTPAYYESLKSIDKMKLLNDAIGKDSGIKFGHKIAYKEGKVQLLTHDEKILEKDIETFLKGLKVPDNQRDTHKAALDKCRAFIQKNQQPAQKPIQEKTKKTFFGIFSRKPSAPEPPPDPFLMAFVGICAQPHELRCVKNPPKWLEERFNKLSELHNTFIAILAKTTNKNDIDQLAKKFNEKLTDAQRNEANDLFSFFSMPEFKKLDQETIVITLRHYPEELDKKTTPLALNLQRQFQQLAEDNPKPLLFDAKMKLFFDWFASFPTILKGSEPERLLRESNVLLATAGKVLTKLKEADPQIDPDELTLLTQIASPLSSCGEKLFDASHVITEISSKLKNLPTQKKYQEEQKQLEKKIHELQTQYEKIMPPSVVGIRIAKLPKFGDGQVKFKKILDDLTKLDNDLNQATVVLKKLLENVNALQPKVQPPSAQKFAKPPEPLEEKPVRKTEKLTIEESFINTLSTQYATYLRNILDLYNRLQGAGGTGNIPKDTIEPLLLEAFHVNDTIALLKLFRQLSLHIHPDKTKDPAAKELYSFLNTYVPLVTRP